MRLVRFWSLKYGVPQHPISHINGREYMKGLIKLLHFKNLIDQNQTFQNLGIEIKHIPYLSDRKWILLYFFKT